MNTGFYTIAELENGNIAAVGTEGSKGVMLMLSSNGDTLWKRYYTYTNTADEQNYTLTFAQTPDKGFAITGYIFDPNISPAQQAWLIKTDCKGFDKPAEANFSFSANNSFIEFQNLSQNVDSCFWNFGDGSPLLNKSITDSINHTYNDTGNYQVKMIVYNGCTPLDNDTAIQTIHITNIAINWNYIFEKTIKIYPNPATNSLNIVLAENDNYEVSIFNTYGNLLLLQEFHQKQFSIDLSSLDQSVYFLRVMSDKGVVVKKFVKK